LPVGGGRISSIGRHRNGEDVAGGESKVVKLLVGQDTVAIAVEGSEEGIDEGQALGAGQLIC
jgi:hypothetical protein